MKCSICQKEMNQVHRDHWMRHQPCLLSIFPKENVFGVVFRKDHEDYGFVGNFKSLDEFSRTLKLEAFK